MHINEMIIKDGNILISAEDRVWNSNFKNCTIHIDCANPYVYRCRFIDCTIVDSFQYNNDKKNNVFENCVITSREVYAVKSTMCEERA